MTVLAGSLLVVFVLGTCVGYLHGIDVSERRARRCRR